MNSTNLDRLITDALAIEAQDAKDAGALGYMARALVQATLPHSKPDSNEFERRNGAFTLVMLAPSKVGLPYGVIPRLMMAWMTTEVVRTNARARLGDSMSEFMRQLDMNPTGGAGAALRASGTNLGDCSPPPLAAFSRVRTRPGRAVFGSLIGTCSGGTPSPLIKRASSTVR